VSESIQVVRQYHRVTKHRPNGYAPSPGFLDWDSQPNPFRSYAGAAKTELPLHPATPEKSYESLYAAPGNPEPLSLETLSVFLQLAFGLSAWKSTGYEHWSLRQNPSSGNLHPTEAYFLCWQPIDTVLAPGIYHYSVADHALECRTQFEAETAKALANINPNCFGAIALTSIHWREEWKYGARALRYCQHDVGHALACARVSASLLSWTLRQDSRATDAQLAHCLGLNKSGNTEAEQEQPDLLAFLGRANLETAALADKFLTIVDSTVFHFQGSANVLSRERVRWPQINAVLPALEKIAPTPTSDAQQTTPTRLRNQRPDQSAEKLIRRRRSAQRMQPDTSMSKSDFIQCLERTMPVHARPPFDAFPYQPAVNLILFVHAVEDVAPGLYALVRANESLAPLKNACVRAELSWKALAECGIPLYQLSAPLNLRKTASQISCFQGIAGHSAFSLGMLANMGDTLLKEGAWAYRRLFWEAGIIGQVLYLEAEACNLSGTGIGCYFDDSVHQLLGLEPEGAWQSLYHFTVGKARVDERLTTLKAYHHLENSNKDKRL